MKSLTIIDTYAPTSHKQKLLIDCIAAAKQFNTDIMLVSHCTLPDHIVNSVNYFIYDADNRFSDNNVYAWKSLDNIIVNVRVTQSHNYPIIRSMRNAVGLASVLDYEFFYFTEFDNIFSPEDVQQLEKLKDKIQRQNKNFLFLRPMDAVWHINDTPLYSIYYETNFFAAKVKPFLKVFDTYFPKTLEEFNMKLAHPRDNHPNCLEHLFYDAYKHAIDESIVLPYYSRELFSTSKINASSCQNTKCMILRASTGEDFLYFANDNIDEYTFKVYINGLQTEQYTLHNREVHTSFKLIKLEQNCDILVEVHFQGQTIDEHKLQYDINTPHTFIHNGHITIN